MTWNTTIGGRLSIILPPHGAFFAASPFRPRFSCAGLFFSGDYWRANSGLSVGRQANMRMANIHERILCSLADLSDGDARTALNALELAIDAVPVDKDGVLHLSLLARAHA